MVNDAIFFISELPSNESTPSTINSYADSSIQFNVQNPNGKMINWLLIIFLFLRPSYSSSNNSHLYQYSPNDY